MSLSIPVDHEPTLDLRRPALWPATRTAARRDHYLAMAGWCAALLSLGLGAVTLLGAIGPLWTPDWPNAPKALMNGALLTLFLANTLRSCGRESASGARGASRPVAGGTRQLLLNALLLCTLSVAWQPLRMQIWEVSSAYVAVALWAGWLMGWGLLLRGTRLSYGVSAGILLVEWCSPGMTAGHLVFATVLSAFALLQARELRELATGSQLERTPQQGVNARRKASDAITLQGGTAARSNVVLLARQIELERAERAALAFRKFASAPRPASLQAADGHRVAPTRIERVQAA